MIRALPASASIVCRLEAETPADELPALARDLDLQWVHRHGRPASPESGLVDAVRRLELPPAPGVAYVAGETTTCLALRDHLIRERGWPRKAVRVKPFWARGRKGLE
jgi:NADPH-dependent ferric siderophore reductase